MFSWCWTVAVKTIFFCFYLLNRSGLFFLEMCLEKRVFYRMMSGLHASINIHLSALYLFKGINKIILLHFVINACTVLLKDKWTTQCETTLNLTHLCLRVHANVNLLVKLISRLQFKTIRLKQSQLFCHLHLCISVASVYSQKQALSKDLFLIKKIQTKKSSDFILQPVICKQFQNSHTPVSQTCLYRIFSIKRRTPIKRRPCLNAGSKLLIFK